MKKKQAKTNTQRQNEFVERQKKLNRVGRPVWGTLLEHEQIKKLLKKLRKNTNKEK